MFLRGCRWKFVSNAPSAQWEELYLFSSSRCNFSGAAWFSVREALEANLRKFWRLEERATQVKFDDIETRSGGLNQHFWDAKSPAAITDTSIPQPSAHKRTRFFPYMSASAGAELLEAKCDSHPSSSEPGETAAAVEFSLSPDGQSVAYQPAYGL